MDEINLLAVAQFQKSHGYERVIRGLKKYNDSQGKRAEVILHLVGDGDELPYYKRLAKWYHLDNSIIFYGLLRGKELQNIYGMADIGLGCFGLYKRKIQYISALKTSEYLLNGLPIVTGCDEGVFDRAPFSYALLFPNDRSDVDINMIVKFYKKILAKKSVDEIRQEIKEYCKNNCDIEVAMQPVIDYILE